MITAASKFNFNFKDEYNKLVYHLNESQLFTAIGLELTAVNVFFHDNSDFKLKGVTFGYFDHRTRELHINVQDPFFANEPSAAKIRAKLLFILLHEIHHKVLLHYTRMNNRDQAIWNMACDYEIHNLLYSYADAKCNVSDDLEAIRSMLNSWVPKNQNKNNMEFTGCFDTKYLEMTAEEIYDELMKEPNKISSKISNMPGNGNGSGNSNQQQDGDDEGQETVIVTELKDENGNTIGKSVNTSNGKKEGDKEYEEGAKMSNQVAKKEMMDNFSRDKGDGTCECSNKLLKKLFKVKIDWEKILKSSIQTEMSPQDYTSWTKSNVVGWCLDTQLPGREEDYSKYGTLIVALDESGSMSDDDVIKAFLVIKEAKEYYKQIILLEHDEQIVKETLIEELDDELFDEIYQRHAFGGTSHKCVFDYIVKYNEEHIMDESQMISCAICITDMESDIEEHQDILPASVPVIYLANIESEQVRPGVKGKVIAMK